LGKTPELKGAHRAKQKHIIIEVLFILFKVEEGAVEQLRLTLSFTSPTFV